MADSSKSKRRGNRSWWATFGLCVAVPLMLASSYMAPIARFMRAVDLDNENHHRANKIAFMNVAAAMTATKGSTGQQRLGGTSTTFSDKLTFCDTNLPSKVESLDNVKNLDTNDVGSVGVCVVVKVYDNNAFIESVLDSILKQTHAKHMEVVAVDNGSTDGSQSTLQKLGKTNKNLQVVRLNQHISEGQAYNIGVSRCSSKSTYVLLNNGILTLDKDAITAMLSNAESLKADVVLANYDVMNSKEENALDVSQWKDLPTRSTFDIYSKPKVLRLAPLASRKLIRLKLFSDIDFSEGHYNSAEEWFHWKVLSHATRISKIDRILFHQLKPSVSHSTDSASFFANAHHIGKMLFGKGMDMSKKCLPSLSTINVAENYFHWLEEAAAQVTGQTSSSVVMKKLNRLMLHTKHYWPRQSSLPQNYWASFQLRDDPPVMVDLTIIMPSYNVKDLVGDVLKSMFEDLNKDGFSFEVFAIDDGSTDGTIDVLEQFQKDHESNFFVLKTPSSNGGAGRARNVAIPLMEGRYVYFVDADDGYDFKALRESVKYATNKEYDLMIFPYETESVGPNNNITTEGMMSADQKLWDQLPSEGNRTHAVEKQLAYGLINYPWKQLTSTRIMRDEDVYFGPTKVHNDVQFHWTSIAASKNLHFYDKKVCTHRRFDASVRGQLTENKSAVRMSVFDSLSLTQRHLARQGAFGEAKSTFMVWLKFSRDVLNWASKRVPPELEKEYKARWKMMLANLKDEKLDPVSLRSWAYWELGGV